MLLDSNVIIYSTLPEHQALRDWIRGESPWVSDISYVETLGFHNLQAEDRALLETFFSTADAIPMDPRVLDRAVALRQRRRMSLADAIIAATALVHVLTLVTRNVDDFRWIEGLTLLNPFDPPAATPQR
jgi:predicted nucleic acid-binding protein